MNWLFKLKAFLKAVCETTNLMKYKNELLTLEYGEVSTVKRLQAAHTLFTALEYTSDPIEIMNEKYQLLVRKKFFKKFFVPYSISDLF